MDTGGELGVALRELHDAQLLVVRSGGTWCAVGAGVVIGFLTLPHPVVAAVDHVSGGLYGVLKVKLSDGERPPWEFDRRGTVEVRVE